VANQHSGNVGDVWKHLWLAGVIADQPPSRYVETHAGSAIYHLVEDEERALGVRRFLASAESCPRLRDTAYWDFLQQFVLADPPSYPGSSLLAMTILGPSSRYVFCDTDRESVEDLLTARDRLALGSEVEVVHADGPGIALELLDAGTLGPDSLIHVDPFDYDATSPGGLSIFQLLNRLAAGQVPVFAWYHLSARELFRAIASNLSVPAVACAELRLSGPRAASAGVGSGCGIALIGDDFDRHPSVKEAAEDFVVAFNHLSSGLKAGVTAASECFMLPPPRFPAQGRLAPGPADEPRVGGGILDQAADGSED
jgi:23S rRNA A2030 N6-methylase RlmJ